MTMTDSSRLPEGDRGEVRSEVHRRIARACIRLERRNAEKKRQKVTVLVDEAVANCVASLERKPVRIFYRELQYTVLKEGLAHWTPSESTFRRLVKRAANPSPPSPKVPGIRLQDFETVVVQAVLAALEMMPDRTVRLRRNC